MKRSKIVVLGMVAVLLAGTAQAEITMYSGAFSNHMWNYEETNVADSLIATCNQIKTGDLSGTKTTFTPQEYYYAGDTGMPSGGRETDHAVYMVSTLTGLVDGNVIKVVLNGATADAAGAWTPVWNKYTYYIQCGDYEHKSKDMITNWLCNGDNTTNDWVLGNGFANYPDLVEPPTLPKADLIGARIHLTRDITVYAYGQLQGTSVHAGRSVRMWWSQISIAI